MSCVLPVPGCGVGVVGEGPVTGDGVFDVDGIFAVPGVTEGVVVVVVVVVEVVVVVVVLMVVVGAGDGCATNLCCRAIQPMLRESYIY